MFFEGQDVFLSDKKILPYGLKGKIRNSFFMGDFIKLAGRPELKAGKRSRKIDVRFTEDEYKLIIGLEEELGITRTELIRIRVLQNGAKVIVNARQLISHLDVIAEEMGRAGNNINQLARHANSLKLQHALNPTVVVKFNELLEEYIQIQKALEVALRKIIRAMGH